MKNKYEARNIRVSPIKDGYKYASWEFWVNNEWISDHETLCYHWEEGADVHKSVKKSLLSVSRAYEVDEERKIQL